MSKRVKGINPKLVEAMTGQSAAGGAYPTVSMLPGDYARKVASRLSKVSPCYKPNKQQLRCGFCGYKANYDVGMVVFKAGQWKEAVDHQKNSGKDPVEENQANMTDYYQYTGYIRCSQCNGAGNWKVVSPFLSLGVMSSLMMGRLEGSTGYMIGELRLFDGSSPQWISDGEERFLDRLLEAPEDSYVWDRLGNLYHKGGRPELAATVFEHSVRIDPGQFESHYTLGDILLQIGELERASHHFRQMLIFARRYNKLDVLKMREMMADGLQKLFDIHVTTKQKVPFMPLKEDFAVLEGMSEIAASSDDSQLVLYDLEFHLDDRKSFLPIAEMYLGNRREEIQSSERTLDKHLAESEKKQQLKRGEGNGMFTLGSEQRPIIVKVKSQEKGEKVALICERFSWHYIMGLEYTEDLTDLKKHSRMRWVQRTYTIPALAAADRNTNFAARGK